MSRVLLLGFVVLTVACGEKTFESLCVAQVPAPEACATDCNPAPGSVTSCPSGFHCASSGKCDTQCTAGGGECGSGYKCSGDGFCVSNGSGGGSSGGDDEPDIDACPAVHVSATKVIPSIQLLIDRSGSMRDAFGSIPSKYQAVQDALVGGDGLDGIVTKLQGSVFFGATLYSDDGGAVCPTLKTLATPGRAMNNRNAIATLIQGNFPVMNAHTPTPPSIDAVVADFAARPAPAGSPPIIVLATDGLPNKCGSDTKTNDESVAAAKAAFAAGIKLYILSVGTINDMGAAEHLQAMANAGLGVQSGQPNATVFIGTSPDGLANAFEQVIGGTLNCDLALNGEVNPENAASGQVRLNDTLLLYGDEWTLDADNRTLHLLGRACTTLKNSTSPKVDAEFPCGTVLF